MSISCMVTVSFINVLFYLIAHAYRKKPMYCFAIVQTAGVPLRVMWQLGRDTNDVLE